MKKIVAIILSIALMVVIPFIIYSKFDKSWPLVVGTAVLLIILFYLAHLYFSKRKPSSNEIDNVYYTGFLFTIFTLVLTTINISGTLSKESKPDWSSIIQYFGLGLSATAIALLIRIFLLSIFSRDDDDPKASEFMRRLGNLTEDFGKLSDNISALAHNTQQRSQDLVQTFAAFDAQIQNLQGKLKVATATIDAFAAQSQTHAQEFQSKLHHSALQFDQHLAQQLDTSAKRNQAHTQALGKVFNDAAIAFDQHLDEQLKSAVKTNQAHTQALGKVFSDAAIAFDQHLDEQLKSSTERSLSQARLLEQNLIKASEAFDEHLAEAARRSLEKTATLIDAATQAFASAIDRVIGEVNRIRQEAKSISFNESAEAIDRLTAAALKTQELADKIANRLESLDRLEKLARHIGETVEGLEKIAQGADMSANALSALGGNAKAAGTAIDEHLTRPIAGSQLGSQIKSTSHSAAMLDASLMEFNSILDQSIPSLAKSTPNLAAQIESSSHSVSPIPSLANDLGASLKAFKHLTDATSASLESVMPILNALRSRQLPDNIANTDELFQQLTRQIAGTINKIADKQNHLDAALQSLIEATKTLANLQSEANGPPFPRHFNKN